MGESPSRSCWARSAPEHSIPAVGWIWRGAALCLQGALQPALVSAWGGELEPCTLVWVCHMKRPEGLSLGNSGLSGLAFWSLLSVFSADLERVAGSSRFIAGGAGCCVAALPKPWNQAAVNKTQSFDPSKSGLTSTVPPASQQPQSAGAPGGQFLREEASRTTANSLLGWLSAAYPSLRWLLPTPEEQPLLCGLVKSESILPPSPSLCTSFPVLGGGQRAQGLAGYWGSGTPGPGLALLLRTRGKWQCVSINA